MKDTAVLPGSDEVAQGGSRTETVSPPTESVTIQHVAKRAKVSPSTVSNVLNGRTERVRSSTHARVMKAVEDLGYVPSMSTRQSKTTKMQTIGLIVPSVANPFWGAVARYVEAATMTYGYKMLLCNADRNALRERNYAEMLFSSGVRGVIFGASPMSFDHLEALVRRGLLVATLDCLLQGGDRILVGSAGIDDAEGGRIVARHLIGLGHKRMGYVSGPIRSGSRVERLAGFREVLEQHGLTLDPTNIYEGHLISAGGDAEGAELGRIGARELLDKPDRPTALLTANDMNALGAYAGARDLGLRIPEDVSIVGFDDISLAAVAYPSLTTVRKPLELIVQQAVTNLISALEETQTDLPRRLVITPELIVRDSTAPPPA